MRQHQLGEAVFPGSRLSSAALEARCEMCRLRVAIPANESKAAQGIPPHVDTAVDTNVDTTVDTTVNSFPTAEIHTREKLPWSCSPAMDAIPRTQAQNPLKMLDSTDGETTNRAAPTRRPYENNHGQDHLGKSPLPKEALIALYCQSHGDRLTAVPPPPKDLASRRCRHQNNMGRLITYVQGPSIELTDSRMRFLLDTW